MSVVEVKTADLIGPALDWAVAKTEELSPEIYFYRHGNRWVIQVLCGGYNAERKVYWFSPSAGWAQGGPLLAKHFRILAGMVPSLDMWPDEPSELLPWAMRKIVEFELGDVVSVPAELMP